MDNSLKLETMRARLMRFLVAGLVVLAASGASAASGDTELFNGKNLAGWDCKPAGQTGHWSVEDGMIAGYNPDKKGSVLWSEAGYGDFELELEYRTPSDDYDSGVFVRGVTHQVQIGVSRSLGRDLTGCIYAPADKRGKYPAQTEKVARFHKPGEWNRLRIVAQGKRIRTYLNGEPFVDYEGVVIPEKGPIGLQLHGNVAMRMYFRNIRMGKPAGRPNIVWLVSEDNSASWLRLYDDNGAPMPNIDRLAEEGIVFNHAFSNAPVCSVARSTIISGCYAPRVGTQYHRKLKPVPLPEGVKMFPWYLRQAGYYTSNCSKEDYNFRNEDKKDVWDASSGKASYRHRRAGQPFFHVQNFGVTHESCVHPNRKDYYHQTTTDPASVSIFPYHPDTDIFRHTSARYLDRHRLLDQQIGEFLGRLEEEGLMDDTFIFYYGDHGGVLPRSKGYAYNNGLHVPMVVYMPKNFRHLVPAERGSRIDGFVEFVDLSATVLNLAGLDIPAGIDGKPFLGPGVKREELNNRHMAFGYADRFDEKYDLVRSLRKGRFLYMRNYQPFNFDGLYNRYRYIQPAYRQWRERYQAGELNARQRQFFEPRPAECLYDLKADPHEVRNLAGEPAYAEVLAELRGQLQRRVKSMPDLSFICEPEFLAEGAADPTGYGQRHKRDIAGLVDIADLSLLPFSEAKKDIERALDSTNHRERYWGLIVCSSFGKEAALFYGKAKMMAAGDPSLLVRVRAAEFLGLSEAADPRPVIMQALMASRDPCAIGLILNTVVLLRDGRPGYEFDLSGFREAVKNNKALSTNVVKRRLEYLVD